MTTISVWILIAVAFGSSSSTTSVNQLGNFPTVQECERVKSVINKTAARATLQCVQATIVKA